MMKDKQTQSASSKAHKDSKETSKNLSGIKKLKTLDFGSSEGFICDVNTGVCGPVSQEKEGKE